MSAFSGKHLKTILVLVWSLLTIFLLLGVSVLILRQPNFPLNLGLIRTTGLAGLWATLLPACLGLAAVLALRHQRKTGAGLLSFYSLFWLVIVFGGLPAVWNARRSFCIDSIGFCITTPWVGRLTVLALAVPFFLVAVWSGRAATHDDSPGR